MRVPAGVCGGAAQAERPAAPPLPKQGACWCWVVFGRFTRLGGRAGHLCRCDSAQGNCAGCCCRMHVLLSCCWRCPPAACPPLSIPAPLSWAECCLHRLPRAAQVGGRPAWLDPLHLPTPKQLTCRVTGKPLEFLLQARFACFVLIVCLLAWAGQQWCGWACAQGMQPTSCCCGCCLLWRTALL